MIVTWWLWITYFCSANQQQQQQELFLEANDCLVLPSLSRFESFLRHETCTNLTGMLFRPRKVFLSFCLSVFLFFFRLIVKSGREFDSRDLNKGRGRRKIILCLLKIFLKSFEIKIASLHKKWRLKSKLF